MLQSQCVGKHEAMPWHLRQQMKAGYRQHAVKEEVVREQFSATIDRFLEGIMEFPRKDCIVCRQLTTTPEAVHFSSLKEFGEDLGQSPVAAALLLHLQQKTLPLDALYCCMTCLRKLRCGRRKGSKKQPVMPKNAEINALDPGVVPPEISNLNYYEHMLTQRARSFYQTIRLKTYSKNVNPHALLKALKGHVLNLPLTITETLQHATDT